MLTKKGRWSAFAKKAQQKEKEELEDVLSNLESADPELCIKLLLFPSVQNFSGLKKKIKSSTSEWMLGFLEQDGLAVLFATLERLANENLRTSKNSLITSMELLHCVGCVKAVMNSKTGLDYVISRTDYTRMLSTTLDSSNVMVKKQVFELLAAMIMYSSEGKLRAIDAMENYKVLKQQRYRFSVLLNELKASENLPYQTAILSFINAAILTTESLTERIQVRNEFIGIQLLDVISTLRHVESDDLLIQLDVFEQRKLEDDDEMEELAGHEGLDLTDHRSVFLALFNKICNTPQANNLLNILQSLLLLNPEDKLTDTTWNVLDTLVQKCVSMEKEEDIIRLLKSKNSTKSTRSVHKKDAYIQTESIPNEETDGILVSGKIVPAFANEHLSPIPECNNFSLPLINGISSPQNLSSIIPSLNSNNTPLPPNSSGMPPIPSLGGIPPPPSLGGIPPPPSLGGIPPPPSLGGIPPPPSLGGIPPPPSSGGIPPPPSLGGIPPPPSLGGIPPPPSLGSIPPPPSLGEIPPPPSLGGIPPPPSLGGIPPPPSLGGIPPPPSLGGIPPPPSLGGIPPPPSVGGIPPPPFIVSSQSVPNFAKPPVPVRRSLSVPKPSSKLRKFNWKKIPTNTINKSEKSVWDSLEKNVVEVEPDYKTIEELFSQKVIARKKEKKKAEPTTVTLIDPTRSMNISIFLKQLRKSNEEILDALIKGNREILSEERLRNMQKYLPEQSEIEMIKSYPGDPAKLAQAERYFLGLSEVSNYKLRINAMIVQETFEEEMSSLTPSIKNVKQSCKDILSCDKLETFFMLILKTGNFMNFGGFSGAAQGFKISSLLELAETKSNKPRMTLLHCVVKEAAEHYPQLLEISKDFKVVRLSRTASVEYLTGEVKRIIAVIQQLKNQVEKAEDVLQKQFAPFLTNAADRVKLLENELDEIEKLRVELAHYLVEDVKRFKLEDSISTFAKFADQVDKAIKENKERLIVEEKRKKREALEAERKKEGKPKSKYSSPPKEEENIIDNLLQDIKKGFQLKKGVTKPRSNSKKTPIKSSENVVKDVKENDNVSMENNQTKNNETLNSDNKENTITNQQAVKSEVEEKQKVLKNLKESEVSNADKNIILLTQDIASSPAILTTNITSNLTSKTQQQKAGLESDFNGFNQDKSKSEIGNESIDNETVNNQNLSTQQQGDIKKTEFVVNDQNNAINIMIKNEMASNPKEQTANGESKIVDGIPSVKITTDSPALNNEKALAELSDATVESESPEKTISFSSNLSDDNEKTFGFIKPEGRVNENGLLLSREDTPLATPQKVSISPNDVNIAIENIDTPLATPQKIPYPNDPEVATSDSKSNSLDVLPDTESKVTSNGSTTQNQENQTKSKDEVNDVLSTIMSAFSMKSTVKPSIDSEKCLTGEENKSDATEIDDSSAEIDNPDDKRNKSISPNKQTTAKNSKPLLKTKNAANKRTPVSNKNVNSSIRNKITKKTGNKVQTTPKDKTNSPVNKMIAPVKTKSGPSRFLSRPSTAPRFSDIGKSPQKQTNSVSRIASRNKSTEKIKNQSAKETKKSPKQLKGSSSLTDKKQNGLTRILSSTVRSLSSKGRGSSNASATSTKESNQNALTKKQVYVKPTVSKSIGNVVSHKPTFSRTKNSDKYVQKSNTWK